MKEKYEVSENKLVIIDPELDINIISNLQIEKKYLYYENKKVLSLLHYHKNFLHGQSLFYSKEGIVLSSSWFYKGKRYGKTYQYYKSSKLYSVERYKKDLLEGKQIYYFEDGAIKTIMNYKNGKLHGEVKLFYDDSKIKRYLVFENGKKNLDHIFDENENLVDEERFSL